jgi:hypothetical protein
MHHLNNLLKCHLESLKEYNGIVNQRIEVSDARYVVRRSEGINIIVPPGCKHLMLSNCKDITIHVERLPIMGISIARSDNFRINITQPASGSSGHISLEYSHIGSIDTIQDCIVDVERCTAITLNDENISDKYRSSTWMVKSDSMIS